MVQPARTPEWSAGYVADVDYILGYYPELNPLRMGLAFLNVGLAAPEVVNACELGFGQGVSVNVHAAGSGVRWWGTDFLPSQAALARELAASAGAGAVLSDQAFADFCTQTDLPDFDFIALHGVWSWISDENRSVIVDFLKRKLNPGGVVYLGYNTQPGWAASAPMRHLFVAHAGKMTAPGLGTTARVDTALAFAERVIELSPLYARANPTMGDWLKSVGQQNRSYLAHEFFNRDWRPMDFAEMSKWLEPARLSYAASAQFIEHVDGMNLRPGQSAFIREIPDPVLRECSRDFMVNRNFRRDYWVKGPRRLSGLEQVESLRRQRVMLATPRKDVVLKVACLLGEAALQEDIYGAILDVLADHKARTIGEIELADGLKAFALSAIAQAIIVLAGKGDLVQVQDEAVIALARPRTDALNARLLEQSRGGAGIDVLASPVTGGAVAMSRTQQLMLLARAQGRKSAASWASFAWKLMASQGQVVLKDGAPLDAEDKALGELAIQAKTLNERLPILKALGVV